MTVTMEYRRNRRVLLAFRIREKAGRKVRKTEGVASPLLSEQVSEGEEHAHMDDPPEDGASQLSEAASRGTENAAANAAAAAASESGT